jgi:hypothetical protein
MRTSFYYLLCGAVISSLAGCSLVGLDDFDIPMCTPGGTQCDELNSRLMIGPEQCMRYQCSQGRCEFGVRDNDDDGFASTECGGDDCDDSSAGAFPGGNESCDGVDNNCNGLVDDAVSAGPSSDPIVANVASPEYVRYGLSTTSGIAVAVKTAAAASFNVHPRDTDVTMSTAQPVGFSRSMDLGSGGFNTAVLAMGCPSQSATRTPPPMTPAAAACRMAGGTCCSAQGATDAEHHAFCWEAEGNYCNDYETCDPASPASDALTGCRPTPAMSSPCTAGEICNEASELCTRVSMGSCALADFAAVELSEREWFVAALNESGCVAGQLRVGYLTENMAAIDGTDPGRNVLLRGDERRSTSYLGIDLAENGCTGGSRPQAADLGAARPAIAMLAPEGARHRPQALVAWIADAASRATMTSPAPAADIEVAGIWQEEGGAGGVDVAWVNAANNGLAQPLDEQTTGVGRPALAAVNTTRPGYVLAYGQDGGGVAFRFIPAFDDPPDVADVAPFRTMVTTASPPRETAPIMLGSATNIPGATGAAADVDFVSVAVGRVDGNEATLGVSWLEDGRVYFSPLSLNAMTGAFSGAAPVAVSAMGARDPALVYTATGLRLAGDFGGSMISDTETGGFVVTWSLSGMLQAARFAESDATGVAAELLDGAAVSLGVSGTFAQPTGPVSAAAPFPRVVYHDGSAVAITAAVCGPSL